MASFGQMARQLFDLGGQGQGSSSGLGEPSSTSPGLARKPAPQADQTLAGSWASSWKKPEFLTPAPPDRGGTPSSSEDASGQLPSAGGLMAAPPPMADPSSLAGIFQMLIGGGARPGATAGPALPPIAGGGLPDAGVPLPSVQASNPFDAMVARYGATRGQPMAPTRTF